MTCQYGLTKEHQKQILEILKEAKVDIEPFERTESEDGQMLPYHRDIKIIVSSYEDNSEDYEMYVEVD